MSYLLLHEADGQEEQIAKKYEVPTFEDYKLNPSCVSNLSELQDLVFTVVYAVHCGGNLPRFLIINRSKALKLLEELGEIPQKVADVPLLFDENSLPEVSWLA